MYFGGHSRLHFAFSTVNVLNKPTPQIHCTLKMDAACAPETLVNIHQNTRHIIVEDRVVMCEDVLGSGGTDPLYTSAVLEGLWSSLPTEASVTVG